MTVSFIICSELEMENDPKKETTNKTKEDFDGALISKETREQTG